MSSFLHVAGEEALLAIQRVVHTSINRIAEFALIYTIPAYWELVYRYPSGQRMTAPQWTWAEGTVEPVSQNHS